MKKFVLLSLYLVSTMSLISSHAIDKKLAPPVVVNAPNSNIEKAIFAAGCFWCEESAFQDVAGVISSVSGYTGGHTDSPTYAEVSAENSGHLEAVEVTYDASKITYAQLLDIYWKNSDPLDGTGQFCDKGDSYRPAIFYNGDIQKKEVESSLKKISSLKVFEGKKILTTITAAAKFWPAEDYHQDYYQKNPVRYKVYRFNCGRDKRLKELWGAAAGH